MTNVERAELEDIQPEAREVFHRTVKRHWYINAAILWFFALSVEFLAWALWDVSWLMAVPLMAFATWVHRVKWERRTADYGALAKARLAEDPPF